jgi:hypothetical protein
MYLLPLLMAILIPARNFAKLMNLGGKRMDFFKGSLVTYAAVVLFATLFGIVAYYSADHYLIGTQVSGFSLNLLDAFGFMRRGAGVAFFQMLAFLFLAASMAHTLTLAQGRWYGWLADVLIIAIISVFTPIAPLRAALVWFFNMIIFHDIAAVQIASCLVLGAALCALSLFPQEQAGVGGMNVFEGDLKTYGRARALNYTKIETSINCPAIINRLGSNSPPLAALHIETQSEHGWD